MSEGEGETRRAQRGSLQAWGIFFLIGNFDLNDVFVRGVANLQVSGCPYVFPVSVNAISEERLLGISPNLASRWTHR